MDAFFESPKHGSNSNSEGGQQAKLDDSLSEALCDNTQSVMHVSQPMETEIQFSSNTVGDGSTAEVQQQHHDHDQQAINQLNNENLILSDQTAGLNTIHETPVINGIVQPEQQVTEMPSHVKLEMENGQVVVVDSNQIENGQIVVVDPRQIENGQIVVVDSSQIENGQMVVVDSSQIDNVTLVQQGQHDMHTYTDQQLQSDQFNHQQQVILQNNTPQQHHQLVVNSDGTVSTLVDSGALIGLDGEQLHASEAMDDDGLDDENNDLKDIDKYDESLAMSPGGFGSIGGVGSSPYTLNGSNVSTHTFRKTEWDVKKLENYVRISFGDVTPMENMEPAQMNRYLISFFRVKFMKFKLKIIF